MASYKGTHSVLAKACAILTPAMNPDIMRGLATVHLEGALDYIDSVARRNFHDCVPGLVYLGYERCTTEEEYREWTRIRVNRRQFEFAESYIYMIKLLFGLQVGDKIMPFKPKYIQIPYCTDGGLIKLGGTLSHIRPVLTNKVISPGHKSLFVRMLGTRKNFYRMGYSIKADGETMTTFVVHAPIYDAKSTKKGLGQATTRAVSCMTHYLLLKYGYSETFKRYLGHVPVVGYPEEITPERYPASDWVIVSTAHTQAKPSGYVESLYISSKIRLAVRRDQWNQGTISMISELFYVIDHFPTAKVEDFDKPASWLIFMGYILVGGQYTMARIFSQMNEHLASLDDFVDEFASDKLSEKGYTIETFYDLAAMLTVKFPDLLAENDRSGNIYEKYYDVMYHVMRPITYAFKNTRHALQRSAKRLNPGHGSEAHGVLYNSLEQVLIRKLNSGAIFSRSGDKSVLETVAYCGDQWYPRITSKVSEQEKDGGSGGRRSNENDHLDVSMIEGGSLLFLQKGDNPTPTANINMYATIDHRTGSIIPNPKLIDLLTRTKVKLDNK